MHIHIHHTGNLTISKVYTIQALLNVVRLPFSITPMAWANYQEAQVAMVRLGEFLLLDEVMEVRVGVDEVDVGDKSYAEMNSGRGEMGSEVGMEMIGVCGSREIEHIKLLKSSPIIFDLQNAFFSYQQPHISATSAPPATLQDITLTIYPGELLGVVGGVGSGKTSLLAALLGKYAYYLICMIR